jgi:hypothetical protein
VIENPVRDATRADRTLACGSASAASTSMILPQRSHMK